MTTALSLYIPGESGLHRLHPLTKLALVASLVIAGFAIPEAYANYAIVVFIILPLSIWGCIGRQLSASTWKVVWPFALSVFLIQGLFWRSGTQLISIGQVALMREGVVFALSSVGRILLVISSFLLLAQTTRPDALMNSLVRLGLPGSLTYIVVTTIQIVPRFQAKALTIIDAQRSRGLETSGNMIRRARALVPLVMPLVLGSLVDVEERAIAIESRAFSARRTKTSLYNIPDSRLQSIFRWLLVGISLLLIAIRIWQSFR